MSTQHVISRPTVSDHRKRYLRRRAQWAVTIGLVLTVLIAADRMGVFGRRVRDEVETYHSKTFRVVKVVDGDTLDVDFPDSGAGYSTTRIRLWGVDTPETKKKNTPVQYFGPEATEATRRLCLNRAVRVELEEGRNRRDKYGRLLAWVYLPDGRLLNRVLVEEGLAYADPRYDHHLKREFRRLQKEARKARRGLWRGVNQSDLPYYYRQGRRRLKLQ